MAASLTHTLLSVVTAAALMASCSGKASTEAGARATEAGAASPAETAPAFSADSAYSYIVAQLAFGPRINNTEAHAKCQRFIVERLRQAGADTVVQQHAVLRAADGTLLNANNILGRWGTDKPQRILIAAHYDTRPHADADPDPQRQSLPVPGANDGASGVAVALEIARLLGEQSPGVGVDILFTDAEDRGNHEDEDSWCLGAEHWSRNLPYGAGDPLPVYGILLDMVGGRDARFNPEQISLAAAPDLVSKVWSKAHASGYGALFPTQTGVPVMDDHVPLIRAGIPTIDIIENRSQATGTFPPYWHTTSDDIDIIDPTTLKAVGQTVANLIYSE